MDASDGRELGMIKRSGTRVGACAMAPGAAEGWKTAVGGGGCILVLCAAGSAEETTGDGKLLAAVTLVRSDEQLLLLLRGDDCWWINDLMSIVYVKAVDYVRQCQFGWLK